MQRTFGTIVGMEPTVPTRNHPDDIVVCSDGTEMRRGDAYLDCRGCAHNSEDDRDEADLTIVEEILNAHGEWYNEYCTENDDFADGYAHIVCETSHDWPQYVEEWIRDNYDGYDDDTVKALTESVCDDLDGDFDCEAVYNRNEYAAYSGDGCCLWGFDIGEQEDQIDVDAIPEFAALNEEGRLAGILGDVNCDVYVGSYGLERLNRPSQYGHCFEVYHCPGGRWDFVVPAGRMRETVTRGIIGLCRS